MAKSYDDPGDEDPIDRAQRLREAAEKAARMSRHDYEHTDPPPPEDSSWPPRPVLRPGHGSPSPTISSDPPQHVKRLGNWGKYIAGMVAGGAAIWTVSHPVVAWLGSRASATDVSEARTYCAGVAASAAASAVAPLRPRLDDAEVKIKRDRQRWDALDKWHRQQFQRRNAPPICQFGPKAESRGNACTMEELDTP